MVGGFMANRKSTRNIGFRVTEEEWRQFDDLTKIYRKPKQKAYRSENMRYLKENMRCPCGSGKRRFERRRVRSCDRGGHRYRIGSGTQRWNSSRFTQLRRWTFHGALRQCTGFRVQFIVRQSVRNGSIYTDIQKPAVRSVTDRRKLYGNGGIRSWGGFSSVWILLQEICGSPVYTAVCVWSRNNRDRRWNQRKPAVHWGDTNNLNSYSQFSRLR